MSLLLVAWLVAAVALSAAGQEPVPSSRRPDGTGRTTVTGEFKVWHKITLNVDGPFAHEMDESPNPFTDYRLTATFHHPSGVEYHVPGYFAADGDAANTSAQSGVVWRVHFAPDRVGRWSYEIHFRRGPLAAVDSAAVTESAIGDGAQGEFVVSASDKSGRDLRSEGRLQYIGRRYLRFAGSGRYFLKVGADAPETLLAYADFDGTVAGKPKKAPLKTWGPHQRDWREGDPAWRGDRGKGLLGAVNYLSGKGCNAFSFLTYNAGGDGDNVWPFVSRNEKRRYDCSKLDQWGVVFDHAASMGMYLHFKLQETENDDQRRGQQNEPVPEALDGGDLGVERKLYLRELVARFSHHLALNWNLGEENTQSTRQQQDMINYLAAVDPYDHLIVVHTYPNQQKQVYTPLLGQASKLGGLSLQNDGIDKTHEQTVFWVRRSAASGRPCVVAFDESGTAAHGQCPDLGYQGFDGKDKSGKFIYTEHEVRRQTLWGTLMGGGAGVEYYFGYRFVENDLLCEDWRSRDRSWDYCRLAIDFFQREKIPFQDLEPADELVGNPKFANDRYCLAKQDAVYVVYLANGDATRLDLSDATGEFQVRWYNPRSGGELQLGTVATLSGGKAVALGEPPSDPREDWVVLLRK